MATYLDNTGLQRFWDKIKAKFFPTSGGTLTGTLTQTRFGNTNFKAQHTSVDMTSTTNGVSSDASMYQFNYDKNNDYFGGSYTRAQPDGKVYTTLICRNRKDGGSTWVNNYLTLSVLKSGTLSVEVSDKYCWLYGLGLNKFIGLNYSESASGDIISCKWTFSNISEFPDPGDGTSGSESSAHFTIWQDSTLKKIFRLTGLGISIINGRTAQVTFDIKVESLPVSGGSTAIPVGSSISLDLIGTNVTSSYGPHLANMLCTGYTDYRTFTPFSRLKPVCNAAVVSSTGTGISGELRTTGVLSLYCKKAIAVDSMIYVRTTYLLADAVWWKSNLNVFQDLASVRTIPTS